jgi:hypothetical protein
MQAKQFVYGNNAYFKDLSAFGLHSWGEFPGRHASIDLST